MSPRIYIEYDYRHGTSKKTHRKKILRSYHLPSNQGWQSPTFNTMLQLLITDAMEGLSPPNILLRLLDLIHHGSIVIVRHDMQHMDALELTPQQSQWVSLNPTRNTLIPYAHAIQHPLISHSIRKDARGSLCKAMTMDARAKNSYSKLHGCVIPWIQPQSTLLPQLANYQLSCVITQSSPIDRNAIYRVLSVQLWLYRLISSIMDGSWSQQRLWLGEYIDMVATLIPIVHNVHYQLISKPNQPLQQSKGAVLDLAHTINGIMDCYQLDTNHLVLRGDVLSIPKVLSKALDLCNQSLMATPESVIPLEVFGGQTSKQLFVGDKHRLIQCLVNIFRYIHLYTSSVECHVQYRRAKIYKTSIQSYWIAIHLTYCPLASEPVPWLYDRLTTGLIHAMGGDIQHESFHPLHRVRTTIKLPLPRAFSPTIDTDLGRQLKDTVWLVMSPSHQWAESFSALLISWTATMHRRSTWSGTLWESVTGVIVDTVWNSVSGVLVDTQSYNIQEQHAMIADCKSHEKPIIGIGPCPTATEYTQCLPTFHHNHCLLALSMCLPTNVSSVFGNKFNTL